MTGPQLNRLGDKGLVDRTKVLRFNFDGMELAGHPGDTLASALLANGIRLVGRSFKYHRPRGILTAGSEEPNALVELSKTADLKMNFNLVPSLVNQLEAERIANAKAIFGEVEKRFLFFCSGAPLGRFR